MLGHKQTILTSRLGLILGILALLLGACNTEIIPEPPVKIQGTFEFIVNPQQQRVNVLEHELSPGSLQPQYLPSDTRILVPGVDIALEQYQYVFHRGNKLVLQMRFKNISENAEFHQPFFFTLNTDTENIKSATAPLVLDNDLGTDGALSPQEKTSRMIFEVRHKGKSFSFFVDASAFVRRQKDGKIAFVSTRDDGRGDIFVMNADGSGLTNLSNHPASDGHPTWSPEGDKLVFYSHRDGEAEIYVMNADGSDQTRLTYTPPGGLAYPAWSPNGQKILARGNLESGGSIYDIYVMNADGSQLSNLTNTPTSWEDDPAWSSDSSKVVFTSNRDGGIGIFTMNADGSNLTRLTSGFDFAPEWSLDGRKIVFMRRLGGVNWEIYTMDTDGSNLINLSNHSANDWEPAWSPDSRQIVFNSDRAVNPEIYTMNADGSNPTRLTHHPERDWDPTW